MNPAILFGQKKRLDETRGELKTGRLISANRRECPICGNTDLTDVDGRWFYDGCGKYI